MNHHRIRDNIARTAIILLAGYWVGSNAYAQEVFQKNGDIYLRDEKNRTKQLTSSSKDYDPALSPDGRLVVFVRRTGETIKSGGPPLQDVTQLWMINLASSIFPELIFDESVKIGDRTFHQFSEPQIASADDAVYFLITYGAATNGLVRLDLREKATRFIAPALEFRLIKSGELQDDIIVQQRRPYAAGGFYNWYWLFDRQGTDLGLVGPDKNSVTKFLMLHGAD